jgi:hypothetical protein
MMYYAILTFHMMHYAKKLLMKCASVKLLQMYFKNVSQKHKKNFFQGKCEICKRVL